MLKYLYIIILSKYQVSRLFLTESEYKNKIQINKENFIIFTISVKIQTHTLTNTNRYNRFSKYFLTITITYTKLNLRALFIIQKNIVHIK